MTETEIKADILKKFRVAVPGGKLFRVWCGHTIAKKGGHIHGAEPGTPDLCGYLPGGRFIGIEAKKPGGTTQKDRAILQAEWRDKCREDGGLCIQAESWQDVENFLALWGLLTGHEVNGGET